MFRARTVVIFFLRDPLDVLHMAATICNRISNNIHILNGLYIRIDVSV